MSSAPLRPAQVTPRPLDHLLQPGTRIVGDPAVLVTDIGLDSRTVTPGALYAALPGSHAHGAQFADQALQRGAVAVLTDPDGADLIGETSVPLAINEQPRPALAHAAAVLFGRPAERLQMIGITGTNGKTTTAFLVEAALRSCHQRVGTIGTIGYRLDAEPIPSSRSTVTTPESVDLQALLATMADAGATAVAMEVSSHALALHRVDEITFAVAGFTNLGEDHQDFHPDAEHYFESKARLFEPTRCRSAVINIDSDWGQRLAARVAEAGIPLVTTGLNPQAGYRLISVKTTSSGVLVHAATPQGPVFFHQDLPGVHNAQNSLLALAIVEAAGYPRSWALAGLRYARVPGRLELIRLRGEAPVVRVDFAHTPQAVEQAIAAVRGGREDTDTAPGSVSRLGVVLGAGGDRDPHKRYPMGAAAASADLVVVTDDNPRTEDPARIRAEVLAGARDHAAGDVVEVADRRAAITRALEWATPGDTVLILGKGHERGQELASGVVDFDDAQVVADQWRLISSERTP